MPHARTNIRHATRSQLLGMQTTGQNVFKSRVFSLDETQLPSISVYTDDEDIVTDAPTITQRRCELVVEGHAAVDDNVDDVLDQIAAEVEERMANGIAVDGVTLAAKLQSTTFDVSSDAELEIGVVKLRFIVPYATRRSTPGSLSL